MKNGTAITASDKLTGQSDCLEVNLDVNISFFYEDWRTFKSTGNVSDPG